MEGGFRVTPETLATSALQIGSAVAQMTTELQQLQTTVTTGSPWGQDGPGTMFSAAYEEVLGSALQTYSSHCELLAQCAEGLQQWAATTAGTDAALAELIRSLSGDPGA